MMKRTFQQSLPICITICAVAGWWASAGDINPPPGAIQGTMIPLNLVESRTPIKKVVFPARRKPPEVLIRVTLNSSSSIASSTRDAS